MTTRARFLDNWIKMTTSIQIIFGDDGMNKGSKILAAHHVHIGLARSNLITASSGSLKFLEFSSCQTLKDARVHEQSPANSGLPHLMLANLISKGISCKPNVRERTRSNQLIE